MAKTITTTVTITTVGDGMNHTDAYQVVNAGGALAVYNPAATGNVQFAAGQYPGMLGVLAVPPAVGVAKSLKGAGGDLGVILAPGLPCLVFTPGGGAGVIIAYGAAVEALQATLL